MNDTPTDVSVLYNEFKSDSEKRQFLETQHKVINTLAIRNKQLEEEVAHLKHLLNSTTPILGEQPVEKIIISPEEALIDDQIRLIQNRSLGVELSLEDVKKLDLLLKNKKLSKEDPKTLKGESKSISISNLDLLSIVKNSPNGTK